ncbi:hypothetical protein OAG92_04850 [Akkermansiaceae bacterium]|nr:hypothetical protein [Akkermansiaceae bacterium]MDB4801557.1 hypothetical protein [Akkermansiaceae bacterium]
MIFLSDRSGISDNGAAIVTLHRTTHKVHVVLKTTLYQVVIDSYPAQVSSLTP